MEPESGNLPPNKPLSAHEAAKLAPHGRTTYDSTAPESPKERLTVKETEVLELLADGLSVKQISDKTGAAVGTVEKHLEHIYPKIGVKTQAAAATWKLRGENKLLRRENESLRNEIVILKQLLAETGGSSAASQD
jgi:DNA-binding CsgD family transcriptional regulator